MDPLTNRLHSSDRPLQEPPSNPDQPQGPSQIGGDGAREIEIGGDQLQAALRDEFYRLLNLRTGAARKDARHRG